MENLDELQKRHMTSAGQCDEMIALVNAGREAPEIPGNLPRTWDPEHLKWWCMIHGKKAWWVADMWRDTNGYPFWVDGKGTWNGYEGAALCTFEVALQTWVPYRDYTGMDFDALPNWQSGWKSILTGIHLTWNDGIWLDAAGNQYWYEAGIWNRTFEDDIQKREENSWVSYRCYSSPGDFDKTPKWTDNAWTTEIGGKSVKWQEDAWHKEDGGLIWFETGNWWTEDGILRVYLDSATGTWAPEATYEPKSNPAYAATPTWTDGAWTTTLHGMSVHWSDAWIGDDGATYAVSDDGIWTKSLGSDVYRYMNSAWTPNHDGKDFSTAPAMDGAVLRAQVGGHDVHWDIDQKIWLGTATNFQYTFQTAENTWFYDNNANTSFKLVGGAWQQLGATYVPPKPEYTSPLTLLAEIKGHADAIKDLTQVNKNQQDIADQYSDPLNNEKEWNEFVGAAGEAYKSGGNVAEECYALVDKVQAFDSIPIIGDLLSLKAAIQSIRSVRNSYTERKAFRKAMRTGNNEAVRLSSSYAFKKVNRRFFSNIADAILKINDFISKIVTLITAGAAAMAVAVSKALLAVRALTLDLALKIKGVWKWVKGTKGKNRSNNADIVLQALMVRDPSAITLVADLEVKFQQSWVDDQNDADPAKARDAKGKIEKARKMLAEKMKSG